MIKLSENGREDAMQIGTLILMNEERYSLAQMSETTGFEIPEIVYMLAHIHKSTKEYSKLHKNNDLRSKLRKLASRV